VVASPTPALLIAARWVGQLPGGRVPPSSPPSRACRRRPADRQPGAHLGARRRFRHADQGPAHRRGPADPVPDRPAAPGESPCAAGQRAGRTACPEPRSARGAGGPESPPEDLVAANTELEETNRGVMALHAELSDELEQTNRGVVALYAELDEASTRLKEASESDRFWASVSPELRAAQLGAGAVAPAAGSAVRRPHTRAAPPGRDDPRLGRHAVVAGQRAADVAKAGSGRPGGPSGTDGPRSVFDQMRASMAPLAPADVALVVEEPRTPPGSSPTPCCWGASCATWSATRSSSPCGRGAVPRPCGRQAPDVVVSDTGVGIPAEHRSRVFEEFHQVPGPLQSRAAGTGLGLPYARRVAELLGGSPGPGQRGRPGHDGDPAAAAGRREGPARAVRVVLVVDDDRPSERRPPSRTERGPGVRGR
jgi:hypothetical protein